MILKTAVYINLHQKLEHSCKLDLEIYIQQRVDNFNALKGKNVTTEKVLPFSESRQL